MGPDAQLSVNRVTDDIFAVSNSIFGQDALTSPMPALLCDVGKWWEDRVLG